ncbi:MAG: hypothetical protein HY658_10530 [Actinobacteria bacterium]|nr:hypothetical protein [Actinomycetota bacterium]
MTRRTPTELRRFVMLRPDVEAVLERCGRETFDLILADVHGNWTRWVVVSPEEARAYCEELGIPMHEGWEDGARVTQRMNRRDHWNEPGGQQRAL